MVKMEWFIVWCLVLILVHVQFKNCVRCSIVTLKVVETSIITFIIKLWYIDGGTMKDVWSNFTRLEL